MTRALTRIRRHVSLRQRLTCRILRRWKKHILAVEETCCVMFSLQSRRTPRSRTTSDGGILHCGSRLRCFVVLSTTLLRRSNQISSAGSTTIRLRTFRLRHFVYRHFVYRHFVYYCIPACRTVMHPTSNSANNYFHQFQLLLTL